MRYGELDQGSMDIETMEIGWQVEQASTSNVSLLERPESECEKPWLLDCNLDFGRHQTVVMDAPGGDDDDEIEDDVDDDDEFFDEEDLDDDLDDLDDDLEDDDYDDDDFDDDDL